MGRGLCKPTIEIWQGDTFLLYESIEGVLYNEDGTEYKKPVPVKKTNSKPTVKVEEKPPVKKQGEVISMFEGLDDIFMTNTDKDDSDDDNDEKEPVNPLADVKPNMLTFPNGDCLYFEYEKQTMFAGPATNTEIIRKYAFAYDNALSSDANIQKLYDYILQQDPSLSILIEEDEPKIEPVVIEEKPKPTLYDRYMEVQNRYPDHIVIVRLGDFYEIFGDNATLIGNELEMTITSRELGNNHRFAMIGFPYHVSEAYFNRITQNHSIVIRESGNETVRNKIEPVKIENDGIIVDKKTGEVVEEQLPYDIKHIAILAELFGMENLEGC